ncbi:MAG: PrsW family glutamic-type intramembrane protease [Chloroflexota bacterium]
MLVLAAPLLLCGLCSGAFYIVAPFLIKNRDSAIQGNIFLGAFAAIGILFGAMWAWQGVVALRGRATGSAARIFPRVIILVSLFLLALALGMGALAYKPIAAFAFPPFHFLAAALPPLALLAFAARQLGATSGLRALLASLGWGALGSTFLALSLEVVIGVIIVIGIGVALALMPEGAAQIERLSAELESLQRLDDQTIVRRLISNPGVIAAAGVYFVGIVPFIEEAAKTLIVAFADPRRTLARDALLWGIAAGAGFAIVENALNTGAALEIWAVAMFVRVGATVMHVANGAIMARGWYAARVERRWSRLFIAYLTSVFLHAVWNALAIGQAVGAVFWMNESRGSFDASSSLLWLNLVLLLGLIVLTFGGAGWIAYSVQTVREPLSVSLRGAS